MTDRDYTLKVMDVAETLRDALGDTDFDIGVNALMTLLAECGKQSTLTPEEFLTATLVQLKHLMDHMVVSAHPVQ